MGKKLIVDAAKFAAYVIPQREQESGPTALDCLQVQTMIGHQNQRRRIPKWEIHHADAQKRSDPQNQKNLMRDHVKRDYGRRS